MQSMSFDPAVAGVGAAISGSGVQTLQAGAATSPAVIALVPAGAEEVSAQTATAFAAEATQMLASFNAAHAELMRTGNALVEIARIYSETDAAAAGRLRAIRPASGYRLAG